MFQRYMFILLTMSTAVANAGTPKTGGKELKKKELGKFQGTWNLVEHNYHTKSGRQSSRFRSGMIQFRLSSQKVAVIEKGKEHKKRYIDITFTIDPTKTPKSIDVFWGKRRYTGIYHLEGNTLKIASGFTLGMVESPKKRATSFDKNEMTRILILTKVKE